MTNTPIVGQTIAFRGLPLWTRKSGCCAAGQTTNNDGLPHGVTR
jgi:hypothetical protein